MNIGQLKEITTRLDTLIERQEPMKDEMYVALRSYLEEHSSLLRQILDEVKGKNSTPGTLTLSSGDAYKVPAEAVGPVTVETVQTLDSGKEDDAAKGKPKAKPAVNWNS